MHAETHISFVPTQPKPPYIATVPTVLSKYHNWLEANQLTVRPVDFIPLSKRFLQSKPSECPPGSINKQPIEVSSNPPILICETPKGEVYPDGKTVERDGNGLILPETPGGKNVPHKDHPGATNTKAAAPPEDVDTNTGSPNLLLLGGVGGVIAVISIATKVVKLARKSDARRAPNTEGITIEPEDGDGDRDGDEYGDDDED